MSKRIVKLDLTNWYLAPSILSADFSDLRNTLNTLKAMDIKVAHFDVMDNHFVPNLTFGAKFIKDLREHSDLFFDTHLMIDSPEKWIDNYIEAGCDNISFHIEATNNSKDIIEKIKSEGIYCGISIKPNTSIDKIMDYLHLIDIVLVMSVEPGFGGQSMIMSTLNKIQELKKLKDNNNYNYFIEVDGGINLDNVKYVSELGADIFVMGSSFFNSANYCSTYNTVKSLLNE